MIAALRVIFLITASLSIFECASAQPTDVDRVSVSWGVKIPMRDGTMLNATLFRPYAQKEALPVVLSMTPYGSDTYTDRGVYFAQNGYVFALVDVRGRGNSGGDFHPLINDGMDGYDLVEWLGEQPFCDGQVAMWGGSYAGSNQWLVAAARPPSLKTIVPAAAPAPGTDFPGWMGVQQPFHQRWVVMTLGNAGQDLLAWAPAVWAKPIWDAYAGDIPFNSILEEIGITVPYQEEWERHPDFDDFWQRFIPSEEQYRDIDIPVLTITGQFDGNVLGAITHYGNHNDAHPGGSRGDHYLVIGPWDHAGTRTPRKSFGGIEFHPSSELDLNALHKAWYDWVMKDSTQPAFLEDRVRYFTIAGDASGEWRSAASLSEISSEQRVFYFDESDTFPDRLTEDVPQPGELTYISDPLDLTNGLKVHREGGYSESIVSEDDIAGQIGRAVILETEPFAEDTVISGRPEMDLWITLDAPDADLIAYYYHVFPDRRYVQVGMDMVRMRYRNSRSDPELWSSGETKLVKFRHAYFLSKKFARGSRFRIVLASPNTPGWQKNFNGGGVVGEETKEDARIATFRIHTGGGRASRIVLPIDQSPIDATVRDTASHGLDRPRGQQE